MELKEMVKILKRNFGLLAGITILGLVSGVMYFFLPSKYEATGTLYVKRQIEDPQKEFFTYEGYYSQQAALSYTNTVAGLIESKDILSQGLERIGVNINEVSMQKNARKLKVIKTSPQLVTITIRDSSAEYAQSLWNALTASLIETSSNINKSGDPALSISVVNDRPVVKREYKSPVLLPLAGLVAGINAGIFVVISKEYFK